MKCERCGNNAIYQEGQKLIEAIGPDATNVMTTEGVKGQVLAKVCNSCKIMLNRLGWKNSSQT